VRQRKKFRITRRFQEIIQVVGKSVADRDSFVWKVVGEKRMLFPCEVVEVDADRNRIAILLADVAPLLSPGDLVYLKLGFRDAAFKTKVMMIEERQLVLGFPDEVALEEKRSSPRYYFHPSEEKNVQIVSYTAGDSSSERLHAILACDVSQGGIAVFIPSKLKSHFGVGERTRLWQVGDMRISPAIEGEILFSIPASIHEGMGVKEGFKVGVRFSTPLAQSVIDRFVQKSTVFSIEDQQLVRDKEFRENVKTNIGKIHTELSKRGPFKKFLSMLEKGTGDTHYIKQHIHLLCQVMAGLGTRLGWISERSVDKLIYIAYLHDIRFMNHPHLARIQGKRDYLQFEPTLTEEEKAAFLESPAYAAEIARQDLSSFPDAIKILSQQKELPDGSGFPSGVSGAQIAPLSSLFIVSHYFVDYVIENPNWTIDEFIKLHKAMLRGNYFQKIMQALKETG
jgi:hypothetical protein